MTDSQRRHYDECIAKGCSHNLAEMFAMGVPPMSNTDREFLEGRGGCYDQFGANPMIGDYYRRQAESQGMDVTGKVYLSGLAAYPGDPRAWVSGRGDVLRVCQERNWNCRGAVNHQAEQREPPAPIPVAPDLIEDEVRDIVESCPEPLSEKQVSDIREKVTDARAPHWAK